MPAPTPDQSVPAPDQIGEKGAAQPQPLQEKIQAGAQKLLDKFTPWIHRPNPDPDKALQVITTAPLEDQNQKDLGRAHWAKKSILAKGRHYRERSEQLFQEKIRKPQIRRQFEKAGFQNPDKAVQVIEFMELTSFGRGYEQKPDGQLQSIEIKYRYKPEDIEFIRKITDGVEDPLKLLNGLSGLVNFRSYEYPPRENARLNFERLCNYVESIKTNPRLTDLTGKLNGLGIYQQVPLEKITTALEEEGQSPDPVKSLLNLADNEYSNLLSAENVGRLRTFGELISSRLRKAGETEGPLFDLEVIPQLLKISSDETSMGMFQVSLHQSLYNAYDRNGINKSLLNAAEQLDQIVIQVPELIDLYKDGFYVADFLSYESGRLEEKLSFAKREQPYMQSILQDERIRTNAKLLARYGLAMPLHASDNQSSDLVRTEDPMCLEKELLVWDQVGEVFGLYKKDGARDYATERNIYNLGRTVRYIAGDLDKFSPEELSGVLLAFQDAKFNEKPVDVPLRCLFHEAETIAEVKRRIELANNPVMQKALGDEDFCRQVFHPFSYAGGTPKEGAWQESLKYPEDLLYLYQYKEDFYRKLGLLKGGDRRPLAVNLDLQMYRELLNMEDNTVAQISDLIYTSGLAIAADKEQIERAKIILSLSKEQREGLIKSLAEMEIHCYGLFNSNITPEALKALAALSSQEMTQLKNNLRTLYDSSSYQIDRVSFSKDILFLVRLTKNPLLFDRLIKLNTRLAPHVKEEAADEDYLFAARGFYQNEVTTFFSNRNRIGIFKDFILSQDKEVNIDDYITAEGLPTGKFIDEAAKTHYHLLNSIISDEVLVNLKPEERAFWSHWQQEPSVTFREIIYNNRDRFNKLVVEGRNTVELYKVFAEDYALLFINNPESLPFGLEERLDLFARALKSIEEQSKLGINIDIAQHFQAVMPIIGETISLGKDASRSLINPLLRLWLRSNNLTAEPEPNIPEETFIRYNLCISRLASAIKPGGELAFLEEELLSYSGLQYLYRQPERVQKLVDFMKLVPKVDARPGNEDIFLQFWDQKKTDFHLFFLENFGKEYINQKGEIDRSKLESNFVKEMILTPERIGAWETLTGVFQRLGDINDSSTRADAYLRIAESLSARTLTGRTEVEALESMQEAFSGLYRKDMTDFEKVTWNILKKQLPFATDERIREDMRNKAVDVESVNAGNLHWVHQAIHNYVRAQNPDYMRALRDYLKNGDGESSGRLKKFAEFYTPDSKPKDDFYTPEIRESLQNAIPEVEDLLDLTEKYFEINPEKMGNLISQIESTLGVNLATNLKEMEESLIEGVENPQLYASFLIKAAKAREGILKLAVGNNGRVKSQLLSLDAVTSGLFKGALAKYLNLYFEPKIKNHALTSEDTMELLTILKSTLLSGELEGDFSGFDKSLNSIENILSTFKKPDQISIRSLELLLSFERHEMNKEWSNFIGLAQDEMIAILTRMGWTEADAKARVIMEDLVRFEKNSYKFALEPLLETTMNILEQEYPKALSSKLKTPHDAYENVLGEKVIKIDTPFNPIVSEFIYTFTAKEIPSDLGKANQFLTEIVGSPEVQADKLCQSLVKGYREAATGERKYLKTKIGEDEIEFYPFSYYGAEGVVMLQNGQRVENPLEKIEQIYKKSIVPAMLHSLREGD